jgi:hypothetical protein
VQELFERRNVQHAILNRLAAINGELGNRLLTLGIFTLKILLLFEKEIVINTEKWRQSVQARRSPTAAASC